MEDAKSEYRFPCITFGGDMSGFYYGYNLALCREVGRVFVYTGTALEALERLKGLMYIEAIGEDRLRDVISAAKEVVETDSFDVRLEYNDYIIVKLTADRWLLINIAV